jgi:HTH-type transcriptional regulator/antitoxin HigA
METLKYKVIKSKAQYNTYCKMLEELLASGAKTKAAKDEIDLLTLLIETWDEAHNSFDDLDPVALLHSLMEERGIKPKNLVEILDVSKGLVSDILNYKKGMSKEVIRKLAEYFAVNQEAFNRPYLLKTQEENSKQKKVLVYA